MFALVRKVTGRNSKTLEDFEPTKISTNSYPYMRNRATRMPWILISCRRSKMGRCWGSLPERRMTSPPEIALHDGFALVYHGDDGLTRLRLFPCFHNQKIAIRHALLLQAIAKNAQHIGAIGAGTSTEGNAIECDCANSSRGDPAQICPISGTLSSFATSKGFGAKPV